MVVVGESKTQCLLGVGPFAFHLLLCPLNTTAVNFSNDQVHILLTRVQEFQEGRTKRGTKKKKKELLHS